MTKAHSVNATGGEGAVATLGIAKLLCLAATPTFAIMALLTGVLGGGRWICSARPGLGLHSVE
jgi:hypothetical protein